MAAKNIFHSSLNVNCSVLLVLSTSLELYVNITMSSMNFNAFRTLSPELSSSLIAKLTRSLFFDSCIGYLSKAEFVSSLPPLHTKPFLPTPRNTLLHLSTTTNLSVLFAPLTNTTSSRLNTTPTLVLAHPVALFLPFGTQFLSISAHCKPLMPSNAA